MTAVMILAAGLGTRLQPYTLHYPKCLYPIQGVPLLGHHLQKLAVAGCRQVVVNVAYRADQVRAYAGDGSRWGLSIRYSQECPDDLLGTGGAVKPALKYWSEGSGLLLISADIYSVIDYKPLLDYISCREGGKKSQCVVVKPPYWVSKPDFYWDQASGQLRMIAADALEPVTFSGIGCFPLSVWQHIQSRQFGLGRVLAYLNQENRLYGRCYQGLWQNVGCMERVADLQRALSKNSG